MFSERGTAMKKYIQDQSSLRIEVYYNKMRDIENGVIAYNIIKSKGYHQSEYISKAINYYDSVEKDSNELAEFLFALRCMKFIKNYYGLSTKKSVQQLLSIGTDSATFDNILKRMLPNEVPKVSLLGFNKNDPESARLHQRLFEMEQNERMFFMLNAVERYVKDGMDSGAIMQLSFKMVHDSILEYEAAENKKEVVNNFYKLMTKSNSFKEKYE